MTTHGLRGHLRRIRTSWLIIAMCCAIGLPSAVVIAQSIASTPSPFEKDGLASPMASPGASPEASPMASPVASPVSTDPGTVVVILQNADGEPIPGACWLLLQGGQVVTEDCDDVDERDGKGVANNGRVGFFDMPPGSYTIEQTTVPDGSAPVEPFDVVIVPGERQDLVIVTEIVPTPVPTEEPSPTPEPTATPEPTDVATEAPTEETTVAPQSSPVLASPAASPSADTQMVGIVSNTDGDFLHCRAEPSLDGDIIAYLEPNSVVELLGPTVDGWTPVVCAPESNGWVSADYLIQTLGTPEPLTGG